MGLADELVDRLQQRVDLHLLVLDVERDLLEVEQPLLGVLVAGLRGRLELLRRVAWTDFATSWNSLWSCPYA